MFDKHKGTSKNSSIPKPGQVFSRAWQPPGTAFVVFFEVPIRKSSSSSVARRSCFQQLDVQTAAQYRKSLDYKRYHILENLSRRIENERRPGRSTGRFE